MKNINNNQCTKNSIIKSQLLEAGIDIDEQIEDKSSLDSITLYNLVIECAKNIEQKTLSKIAKLIPANKKINSSTAIKNNDVIDLGMYTYDIACTLSKEIKDIANIDINISFKKHLI